MDLSRMPAPPAHQPEYMIIIMRDPAREIPLKNRNTCVLHKCPNTNFMFFYVKCIFSILVVCTVEN